MLEEFIVAADDGDESMEAMSKELERPDSQAYVSSSLAFKLECCDNSLVVGDAPNIFAMEKSKGRRSCNIGAIKRLTSNVRGDQINLLLNVTQVA